MTAHGARFDNLADLQKAHLALLQREPDDDVESMPEPFRKEIGTFMEGAKATGVVLDRDRDRRSAQAAIDYWTTTLVLAGLRDTRRNPPVVLDGFDPKQLPDLASAASPYKGLAAFGETDAANFFGREQTAVDLVKQIAGQPLVIVSGPSGSGKSSLIRAGAIPLLRGGLAAADGTHELLAVVTPGRDPVGALLSVLLPGVAPVELVNVRAEVMQSPARLASLLDRRSKPVILVIDQFEELFTLQPRGNDEIARVIGRGLGAMGERHRLVLSLREDHRGGLQSLPVLGEKAAMPGRVFKADALSSNALKRIIEAPAESAGLHFEDGIVDDLVRQIAGEPAALPLLQFTLSKLWEARTGNIITLGSYRAIGNPRQVLAHAADEVFKNLADDDKTTARRLLMKLVTPSTGNEFVRSPQSRATLEAIATGDGGAREAEARVDRVLGPFIAAGLLQLRSGQDQFDVAHEALISNWQTFDGWLREASREERTGVLLEAVARRWRQSGANEFLLKGLALREAYAYRERSEDIRQLIRASEDRRRLRIIALIAFAITFISAILGAGWIAMERERITEQRAHLAVLSLFAEERNAALEARDKALADQKDRLALIETLRAEVTQATQADEGNRRRLKRIDQAVLAGDEEGLREVLREIGIPEADARRVSVEPAPSGAKDRVGTPPGLDQTVDQQRPSLPLATEVGLCSGALWIGNPDNSKVRIFPQTTTGLKDTLLQLEANIVLRTALPPEDYRMPPALGIVPARTVITATGDAKIYSRSLGAQWWVPVTAPRQVCSKVFIQYVGARETVRKIADRLRNAGYQVPEPEEIAAAAGLAEVRYFFDDDATVAKQVAQLAEEENAKKPVGNVRPDASRFTRARQGTVELWLDLR